MAATTGSELLSFALTTLLQLRWASLVLLATPVLFGRSYSPLASKPPTRDGIAITGASNQMRNPRADRPLGPYESLNRKAGIAKDDGSVRDLFIEIQGGTLGCDLPKAFLERLVRGERRFQHGRRSAITESELADAVNGLGHELNPSLYSGTNALQIHLLRVSMSRQLGTLLAAPPSSELQQETFAPAGAVYMGFLLLRQRRKGDSLNNVIYLEQRFTACI